MKLKKEIGRSILRDAFISIFLYALPVALMLLSFYYTGSRPWKTHHTGVTGFHAPHVLEAIFKHLETWGLPAILVVVGIIEFSFGLYESRWKKNERILDIVCFFGPKLLLRPAIVFFSLKILPWVLPGLANSFSWVPFLWACFIIAVADDLTQYWYHRLHHQVPFLWRFHRTHHSAPYMGMAMASRQNIIYTVFFSQIYLLAGLTYLGLGYAALFVTGIKSLITLSAHSSIPWDKPFYKYKVLNPVAWVLERLISTPATHQAHHADTAGDGVGNYKGNFGNMFFLWDIIFGTGIITRRYPTSFGIKHYKEEEWHVQFLWPFFKSRKAGSELAVNGPMVGDEEPGAIALGPDLVEIERNGKKVGMVRKGRIKTLTGLSIFLLLSNLLQGQNSISFERLGNNPIIGPALVQGVDGEDINGPSLVRTPEWLSGRLGKYYLYFAHHKGKYIRLAYADDLAGPWKIYQPGTLQIRDCKVCETGLPDSAKSVKHEGAESAEDEVTHVASPDVLIDNTRKEFVLYFHCPIKKGIYNGQYSLRAVSKDGIHFTADSTVLGYSYFRVFRWKGYYYSLSRAGLLGRSKDGIEAFEKGPNPFAGIQDKTNYLRHAGVALSGDTLLVFYSRIGDSPERILLSTIALNDDWNTWTPSKPVDIVSPTETYEGGDLPVTVSKPGLYYGKTRELRDPYLFRDAGKLYLLYTVAGESGIAIGELKFNGSLPVAAAGSIPPLPVDSFAAKINRETAPQIVDVRTPEKFVVNHLNGAINIDLRAEGYIGGLSRFDKGKPVFIYAIQNYRPGLLADELRKNGYKEVYELKSGIASWIGAGYPYYTAVKGIVSLADYNKSVGKGFVLVDIGTKYCGLCRQVKGMMDSLRSENDPSYTIVEIDLYNNPQLVAELKEVQAVPTLLLYKDDKIVWKRTGLSYTKSDIDTELHAEIAKTK